MQQAINKFKKINEPKDTETQSKYFRFHCIVSYVQFYSINHQPVESLFAFLKGWFSIFGYEVDRPIEICGHGVCL